MNRGSRTQQPSPHSSDIFALPAQRLNLESNSLHLSNTKFRLLSPRLLATSGEMLDSPGVRIRRPVVGVDRVQHLGGSRLLADLGEVLGHGGGRVGHMGVRGLVCLVLAMLRGRGWCAIIVVHAVLTNNRAAEGATGKSCRQRDRRGRWPHEAVDESGCGHCDVAMVIDNGL